MNNWLTHDRILLFARLLMASMFVESFIDKLAHWEFYLTETTTKGIPLPTMALGAAVAVEFLGSLALITGIGIRLGVLLLAGYVFVLGFFYFDFWNMQGPAAIGARKEFLKDFAVIGGLLMLMVTGAGNSRIHSKRGDR